MFDKQDLKERFANMETFGGVYMIAAGIIILMFHERITQLIGFGILGYGIRTFFVNRIKEEKKRKELTGE